MKVVKISVVVLVAFLGCTAAITYQDVLEAEFETFKGEYEKSYDTESEEQLRKQIFKDNKAVIDRHNARYEAGEETYEMGVNQFTDLLPKEFEAMMLTKLNVTEFEQSIEYTYTPAEDSDIPKEVDWRAKGAVTNVKNQGQCGSCWAFSAAGALEAHNFIKTKQLIPLSEQNLVDCSARYNNHGCHGGWPSAALMYVKDNGGMDNDKSYPYEGRVGQCRFRRENIGAKVTNVYQVKRNEASLAKAIAEKGPISIAVDASKYHHYRGGIFNDRSCRRQPNHAMLLVGYGHDQNGGDYWLIKNSWGGWGEQGYMRLARNQGNLCSVASYAVFPAV